MITLPQSLLDAVHAVNQDVAAAMPHDSTEAEIAEMCLDQWQFQIRGEQAAWTEYKALCAEHGHQAVFDAIVPTISCW